MLLRIATDRRPHRQALPAGATWRRVDSEREKFGAHTGTRVISSARDSAKDSCCNVAEIRGLAGQWSGHQLQQKAQWELTVKETMHMHLGVQSIFACFRIFWSHDHSGHLLNSLEVV